MSVFNVKTSKQTQFVDITSRVQDVLAAEKCGHGLCLVFIPHTTAAVTINENADPSVVSDIQAELAKIVPFADGYSHLEGNSAAHIKASLFGSSVLVPVSRGTLGLGTWQGIYFCEFDGPRKRSVQVHIVGGKA